MLHSAIGGGRDAGLPADGGPKCHIAQAQELVTDWTMQAQRAPRCQPVSHSSAIRPMELQCYGDAMQMKNKRHLSRTGRMTERFIQLRWRSPFHHEADPVSQNCYCSAQGLFHPYHHHFFDGEWGFEFTTHNGASRSPQISQFSCTSWELRVARHSI